MAAKQAVLEVTVFDLDVPAASAKNVFLTKDVELAPNASTELYSGKLPGQPTRTKLSDVPKTLIVSVRLLEKGENTVLGRYSNWYVLARSGDRGSHI